MINLSYTVTSEEQSYQLLYVVLMLIGMKTIYKQVVRVRN